MKTITTSDGAPPAGHYSQAIVHNGVVYCSGVLGKDPANPDADPGDAGQQTRQALANIETVLAAAGTDLSHVVRMIIYVSGIELWPAVNEAYAEVMGEDRKPTRAIVPVGPFSGSYTVEAVATAVLPESD